MLKRLGTFGDTTNKEKQLFDALYQKALTDEFMQKQRDDLIQYADRQVAENEEAISKNLRELGIAGFDLVWEGNGFNGVGYGGMFAVLDKLQLAGKRMGASGGAASAILASAGADKFLLLYQTYQLFYKGWDLDDRGELQKSKMTSGLRLLSEVVGNTGFTSAVYEEAVREDEAFLNAQKNVVIAALSKKYTNTSFRGFQNRAQLVKAGYSSGDCSIQGLLASGTEIPSPTSSPSDLPLEGRTSSPSDLPLEGSERKAVRGGSKEFSPSDVTEKHACGDGGDVLTLFADPTPGFGLLIYHTRNENIAMPTKDSIPKLFRDGVDDTVAVLQTNDLLLLETSRFRKRPVVRAVGVSPESTTSEDRSVDLSGVVSKESFKAKLGHGPKDIVDVNFGSHS